MAPDNERVPPGIRSFLVVTEVFRLLRLLVWFGGISLIVYLAIPLPLSYTAGKETSLHLLLGLISDLKLHVVIPYPVVALFLGLWLRERHVRKTSVEREHRRVAELERLIDPGRTSSGLEE